MAPGSREERQRGLPRPPTGADEKERVLCAWAHWSERETQLCFCPAPRSHQPNKSSVIEGACHGRVCGGPTMAGRETSGIRCAAPNLASNISGPCSAVSARRPPTSASSQGLTGDRAARGLRASGSSGWPPGARPHATRTTRRPPSAAPSSSTAVTPPRPLTTTGPVVSSRRPLLWVRSLLVAWDLGWVCGFGFRGWGNFSVSLDFVWWNRR